MAPARHETLLTIEYKVIALDPIMASWQKKMCARAGFAQGQRRDVSPFRNGAQILILLVLRCFGCKHLGGDAVHAKAHGGRTTCATKLFSDYGQRQKTFAEAAQMARDVKSQQAHVDPAQQVALRDHVIEPEFIKKARLFSMLSPHHRRIFPLSINEQESSFTPSRKPFFDSIGASRKWRDARVESAMRHITR